ncbi:MAG: alpha/beta hydrolase [Proteobacteria bacterium]|nr:alpha/beta hydrolase [Pseudomonadota bacterium]
MLEGKKVVSNYLIIDQSSILRYVFYPRNDYAVCPKNAFDISVTVEDNVSILCRAYKGEDRLPWILYFHGNGEVVSDYDEIAPFYTERGLNLVVADYRGYGMSEGIPTLTNIVRDAHTIFKGIKKELTNRGYRDKLWIMGRSLGSISALELAYHYQDNIMGLIVESGFPSIVNILTHLGVPVYDTKLDRLYKESLEMIQGIFIPTLIIHGEYDTLVPLKEGEDLYTHIGTEEKHLLIIPGANHNDIMFIGFKQYFDALKRFIEITDKTLY